MTYAESDYAPTVWQDASNDGQFTRRIGAAIEKRFMEQIALTVAGHGSTKSKKCVGTTNLLICPQWFSNDNDKFAIPCGINRL